MIVEFTGPTGAGKSTLCAAVISKLRDAEVPVLCCHAAHFTICGRVLGSIRSPTLQNLSLDLKALTRLPRILRHHGPFLAFCRRAAREYAHSLPYAANAVRSVLRKLGTLEIARDAIRQRRAAIVVVDEGTLHCAHNVLVSPLRPPTDDDVRRFAELVPLADRSFCVQARAATLKARVAARADPPMRADAAALDRFVAHAHETFRVLTTHARIRERTLLVDDLDDDDALDRHATHIAGLLAEDSGRSLDPAPLRDA